MADAQKGSDAPGVLDAFVCPITHEVMRDPVILLADGHTYERKALANWLRRKLTSPLTGKQILSRQTIANMGLRHAIEQSRLPASERKNAIDDPPSAFSSSPSATPSSSASPNEASAFSSPSLTKAEKKRLKRQQQKEPKQSRLPASERKNANEDPPSAFSSSPSAVPSSSASPNEASAFSSSPSLTKAEKKRLKRQQQKERKAMLSNNASSSSSSPSGRSRAAAREPSTQQQIHSYFGISSSSSSSSSCSPSRRLPSSSSRSVPSPRRNDQNPSRRDPSASMESRYGGQRMSQRNSGRTSNQRSNSSAQLQGHRGSDSAPHSAGPLRSNASANTNAQSDSSSRPQASTRSRGATDTVLAHLEAARVSKAWLKKCWRQVSGSKSGDVHENNALRLLNQAWVRTCELLHAVWVEKFRGVNKVLLEGILGANQHALMTKAMSNMKSSRRNSDRISFHLFQNALFSVLLPELEEKLAEVTVSARAPFEPDAKNGTVIFCNNSKVIVSARAPFEPDAKDSTVRAQLSSLRLTKEQIRGIWFLQCENDSVPTDVASRIAFSVLQKMLVEIADYWRVHIADVDTVVLHGVFEANHMSAIEKMISRLKRDTGGGDQYRFDDFERAVFSTLVPEIEERLVDVVVAARES